MGSYVLIALIGVQYFAIMYTYGSERHFQSSNQNYKPSQRTAILHCRPRRTCDAASKGKPHFCLGCWAVTWIQFAALLFFCHVSKGTSPSQKLFICDGRKYLTPSEVGRRTNIIWILDMIVTKII